MCARVLHIFLFSFSLCLRSILLCVCAFLSFHLVQLEIWDVDNKTQKLAPKLKKQNRKKRIAHETKAHHYHFVCVSVCAFAFVRCVKKTWDAVKVLQITRAGAQRSATMKSSVKIRLPDCETWMNKCVRTKVCILFVHIHTERDIHSQKLSAFTSICIRTWTFRNNPFFFPILWCFVLIVIWKFHNLQIFKQMTMNSASGHTKCDFVRRLLLLSLHCQYHYYYCCCCSHRLYWDREREQHCIAIYLNCIFNPFPSFALHVLCSGFIWSWVGRHSVPLEWTVLVFTCCNM